MKQAYIAYSECWKLFSRYTGAGPKDQSYWSSLVDDASRLYESAPSRLMKKLIQTTLKELEDLASD